jgi:hypothetical protein
MERWSDGRRRPSSENVEVRRENLASFSQKTEYNQKKKKPTRCAVWWAENEPVSDGGNPPRPIRLFRMTEHSTQDLFASRVPVHSALVQKSVTTSTNSAGRLSLWMLGNNEEIRKWKMQNSWQEVC